MASCLCTHKNLSTIFVLLFLSTLRTLSPASYGSDTTVSIVNPFNIPVTTDNIINTFGCAKNGFAFVDSSVSCSFNSIFPVAGPISLRGGKLYLKSDLILTNTGTFADLGTIIGANHVIDLSQTTNSFASLTNPSGARTLALIARATVARAVFSLDWSYDNQYIAAVTTSSSTIGATELFIYRFNGTSLTLTTSQDLGGNGTSVRWRPNSYYLAVAAANASAKLRVYRYNTVANRLERKITVTPPATTITSVAWQGRGEYLAAAGTAAVYTFRFNEGTETLDNRCTPTNTIVGNAQYDNIHWAPVGNRNDLIVGTGTRIQLYTFDNTAATSLQHLKTYNIGVTIRSLDWAPTSTYLGIGSSTGLIRTYQHTAATNTIGLKSSFTGPASTNGLSWKPNAAEISAGFSSSTRYDFQLFSFNSTTYALTNVYNIEVGGNVNTVKFSNTDGTYIARADNTSRYLSVYKENYSPFIMKDVNLFLSSDLTIGIPLTFQGNCSINGRGSSMTFTGDGTINVSPDTTLNVSNIILNFEKPNAFAMQGKTSKLIFNGSTVGLKNDVIFGDGSWETYNDVLITGPYRFSYATENTSTIHANSYLKFANNATFGIGKTRETGPSVLNFENNASHLVFDNATLNVTNSGLLVTKGIVDVYGNTVFSIDNEMLDLGTIDTMQSLIFGDGISAENDPLIVLHGNGTNLTIQQGSIIFDPCTTPTLIQFQGQSQLSFDTTASTYFKRSIKFIDGWIRPVTSTSFYIEPGQFVTANNVRFDYRDLFADYNVTGTLINPTHTLLGDGDYIYVNRGNSVESLTIQGSSASYGGAGVPYGSINLDQGSTFYWSVPGTFGLNTINLNGGRIVLTQNIQAIPGFSFSGTGTVEMGSQIVELGTGDSTWSGNLYWDSNGGLLKINGNITIDGIWTLSGNLVIDGNNYLIDLDPTGTIILERGAQVTFQNISLYDISRQTPVICTDNSCQITLNFADIVLSGDYLFDKGSIFVYYDSTIGTLDGLDGMYTFTYESTQTSTIDSICYLKILPNTRLSIGRQNSTVTDPEQQPLVFNDPLTSKLILDSGTLHITSSGMRLTKGTVQIQGTSYIEVETPIYEYGLILGDGTLDNDLALIIDPGVELNITRGSIFYENNQNNRIVFSSPASSLNIQSNQGFFVKTNVNFSNGWCRFGVATPFYIDSSAYLTLNNQRFEYPALFCDYSLSGTLVDSSNIILGSDDFIAITRGNSVENILIDGQNIQLTGVGSPLGAITFADNTATLTWDIAVTIGLKNINLNGGRILVTQDVKAPANFTIAGTGTIDIGNQTIELGSNATTWPGNIYWSSNGGTLALNNDIILEGIWTFSGNLTVEGKNYLIDFDPSGTLILERGAQVTFKDISLFDMKRQTPIICTDDNCTIILNLTDFILSGDYLFDKGSIYVYYNSNISTIDGFDGMYTFTYASQVPSTIDTWSYLKIWPHTRFSIGRQDSTITDPEQQPLIFNDALTAHLILNGGTLHVTSSGMILTKGTLEIQDTSDIEVETPKYEYGLVLGDGTADNDFKLLIDPGVQLNIKSGTIFYQNYDQNRLIFGSPSSSIDSFSPSGLWAKTNTLFKDGTVITDNATGLAVSYDPGVTVDPENITRITRGDTTYAVKKVTAHGGVRPYGLINGDSYYLLEGFTADDVVAQSGTSYFGGPGGFGGTLTIHDHTATLQTDLLTPLFCNIALNGGTLIYGSDGTFANDYTLTGSGKIQFLGTNLSFGPDDTNLTCTLYLQGLTSGGINLNSKASLSSTWTFGGLMQLNGNGNVLDMSNRGVLTILPGATLSLENITLKGIGSGKGNINFMSDTSTLKFSNVYLELDNDFTTTIGGILINGPSVIGTKNFNWLLDQNASMTIDGVTLWQDPLDKINYGKIIFGSGPTSKYLSLISSGTIKTATSLDLVTQSTQDFAAQLNTIDHGPSNIQIASSSRQLAFDIFISSDHMMNITDNTVINGNGHTMHLANNANGVITIATGKTATFQNIIFKNYTDSIFALGAGAQVIFGDGVRLEFAQNQTIERQWTFTGNSQIYGNGYELAIDPYSVEVLPHSALTIHGVALTGLKNLNLHGDDATSSIILSEVTMYLDHNFSITTGALVFDPDVVIVGTNTFTYASNMTSSIARDSQLYMSGITFNYEPPIANRDLFAMVDQSSRLFIDGCTLSSTTTGMRLTNGTLIADHKNFLDNPGATSISEGFAFGDGNPDHDLSIEVKPGGSLNLITGQWDYQNSNI